MARTAAPIRAAASARAAASGRVVVPLYQNIFLQSDTLDNGSWSKSNLTVTPNQAINPTTGAMTADLISDTVIVGAISRIQQIPTVLLRGHIYTISGIIKPVNAGRWFVLGGNGGAVATWYDIVNGVLGTVSAGTSATIVALSGAAGWYRISFTFKQGVSSDQRCQLFITNADATTVFTGDGTHQFYIGNLRLTGANWTGSGALTTTVAINATNNIRSLAT